MAVKSAISQRSFFRGRISIKCSQAAESWTLCSLCLKQLFTERLLKGFGVEVWRKYLGLHCQFSFQFHSRKLQRCFQEHNSREILLGHRLILINGLINLNCVITFIESIVCKSVEGLLIIFFNRHRNFVIWRTVSAITYLDNEKKSNSLNFADSQQYIIPLLEVNNWI